MPKRYLSVDYLEEPQDEEPQEISPSSGPLFEIDLPDLTGPTKKLDLSKALTGTLLNKMKILADAIQEIDDLIQLRKALSDSVYQRIDGEISETDFDLSELKHWQLGHNAPIETRRVWLEREILALTKEKRQEDVKKWEHITSLLKIRRELNMELQALRGTQQTLELSSFQPPDP